MYKFQKIYEGVFTRFQGGGFLTGDLVKLSPKILSSDWMKTKGDNWVQQISKFLESDFNIRVSSVKTLRPQVQGGTQQDSGVSESYFADIALEEIPGKFLDFTEVPCEFLEMIDTGINLSPIADSQKRESDVNIKPEEMTSNTEDDQFGTIKQTGMDDPHHRSTPTTNAPLPGSIGATSYTAGYIK